MINLLIAEDQAMLLSVLASLLDLEDDINVVHQASNGKLALDYLADLNNKPVELLITDIEMPEMGGLELAQEIQHLGLETKTLILTTFSRSGYLRRAMDAGVKGYLLKDSPSDELLAAIRKIAAGGKAIAPELMENAWMDVDPLTEKERKALRLAAEGLTTEQISLKLHLSNGTVRNYLSNAANKLGATNRIEAARIARQNGWL